VVVAFDLSSPATSELGNWRAEEFRLVRPSVPLGVPIARR
jgi:hypothetical protein